jgi:hypothetical protein
LCAMHVLQMRHRFFHKVTLGARPLSLSPAKERNANFYVGWSTKHAFPAATDKAACCTFK